MRRTPFIVASLTLAATWLGPLPPLAQQAFCAHMTMHMSVVAVATPCIAVGIVGGLWLEGRT